MIYGLQTNPDMAALAFPGTKDMPGWRQGDFKCTLALMEPGAKLGKGPVFVGPLLHASPPSFADSELPSPIQACLLPNESLSFSSPPLPSSKLHSFATGH